MTTSGSDFEAAKAVADQLKGMEKERQERILRWVSESLNLPVGTSAGGERRTMGAGALIDAATPPRDQEMPGRHQPAADIKSFVENKKPKSDVQFAAVVAYYYRFEASAESRRESINADLLQNAARLSGRRRPPSPLMTLNNAKNLGYLDSPERGQFRVNSVGENLVAMTLPGTEQGRGQQQAARAGKATRARSKKR